MKQDAVSAHELLRLFILGNAHRMVSGTKMNAESSRSHSIFGIILEVRAYWLLPTLVPFCRQQVTIPSTKHVRKKTECRETQG